MKHILLVNPYYINETWLTDGDDPKSAAMQDLVPLGLVTIAGLTPEDYKISIWDETIRGVISEETVFDEDYAVVGVTSWTVNIHRCKELGGLFRRRGILCAIGGPGCSGRPDMWRDHFDIVFVGEAELTWPQFLVDLENNTIKPEYRQIQKPDMDSSPMPRWDGIEADIRDGKYVFGAVQTTRGCPFDCEFCDVIYLYGRRQRHKSVERVLEEIRALEKFGITRIFFSDDEFIGDAKYAKELLRALIPLNNAFNVPLNFCTQLTMNLARDDELLGLMADANFSSAIIGIETPNKASLKETGKYQNLSEDMNGDIRHILSYGIEIIAGIIVGFDNDGPDIFDIQYDFINDSKIPSISLNTIKAAIGTRLWSRLRQEGRVLDIAPTFGKLHSRSNTNIIPKGMTREQLLTGFRDLYERLHEWDSFETRMKGWAEICRRSPRIGPAPATPEEVIEAAQSLGYAEDDMVHIRAIVEHTRKAAPHMMSLMKRLIIKHYKIRRLVAEIVRDTDIQIELERTKELVFELDNRPVAITPEFRKAFRKLFPPVYERIYTNLSNLDHLPVALTEVFVDMLIHLDGVFERLEEYHHSYLREVSDRTCARLNGVRPETFVPKDATGAGIPDFRKIRLHDDILKNVGQELFTLLVQNEQQAALGAS